MASIYHPTLDVTREVPLRQVQIWERSGWQLVPPETPSTFAEHPPLDESTSPDGDDQPDPTEEG